MDRERIEGVVERIVYADEESGWSVIQLGVEGRGRTVPAVGTLPGVRAGERLRLFGEWIVDRKYGRQFRVDSYLAIEPDTVSGIERYLASGLVRGIGRGLARALVGKFGLETLEVIENDPDRLTEVAGIGPHRSRRIREAWTEQRAIRLVMVFLQTYGVATGHALRIYKEYGDQAIARIKENPYRLALDVFGIGFRTADGIARRMGIAPDSPQRAEAGTLHFLWEQTNAGHLFLPRDRLVSETAAAFDIDERIIAEAIGALAASGRIVVDPAPGGEPSVYPAALHAAEVESAERIRRLLAHPPRPLRIDVDRALAWVERTSRVRLGAGQREALARALREKVLVVTGGPGTGKTTLVERILTIFEMKGHRAALAAPTGRAAKRLAEASGREAKTLHRLLEFSPRSQRFERDADRPLAVDLLVVDEVSMVDCLLLVHLLRAVPPAARLLLVGDADQLPSVGAGNVLRDLIGSGVVPVARLEEIFRQAESSRIVTNAHRINRGEMPSLDEPEADGDFFFVERGEPEEVLSAIEKLVAERIPQRFGLDPLDQIQVLTPMHKGPIGAANLNAALQKLLNPDGKEVAGAGRALRIGDKVMQIRNNYDLEVFNGDIGRIVAVDPDEGVVLVRIDDRTVAYAPADLDELAPAYAVTVHKAQGSEYPCVVVPIHTQHYVLLQRNLLYTAVTRGKRLVVLVGTKRALAIAVRNNKIEQRHTRLAERLKGRSG